MDELSKASLRRAVILTTLAEEYQAVRQHLDEVEETVHKGTVYEEGVFATEKGSWRVAIAEVGAGGQEAAAEATRAIDYFSPEVALSVGVAGGLKDVRIGDVVTATKVYAYESGKAGRTFQTRAAVGNSSYALVQRARAEKRRGAWLERIRPRGSESQPRAFVGAIAAGEKVVANTRSAVAQFLKDKYGDALAVEMGGYGFLKALHQTPEVMPLVVRGISNLIDKKAEADGSGSQALAANNAGAFAFEILSRLSGPNPMPWRRRSLLVALGIILAALTVTAVRHCSLNPVAGPSTPLPPAPTSIGLRPAVAILGLENLTGRFEDAWLAIAIGEMLVTELEAGGQIRVVSSAEATRVRQELETGKLPELTAADLTRLGQNLGVDLVVWGTYSDLGERTASVLRLDLRLQRVSSGELLETNGATGTPDQLFSLVDRAVALFRERLGADPLTPAQTLAAEASLPSDTDAVRHYSEGLDRLRQFDARAARDLFQKVIAAEPEHPMAYAALAEAWSALGDDTRAQEAAGKARELAGNLSGTERSRIEARFHTAANDWDEASRIYGNLSASFPDDVELGFRLAEAQIKAGVIPEALVTLERLRKLPEPASLDPRIDLGQAMALSRQGDFEQARFSAERAIHKAMELEAPLLGARARIEKTVALQQLGRHDEAIAALQEARQLFEEGGDRLGTAKALELTAVAVLEQGDLSVAQRMFEEARTTYQDVGNQSRAIGVLATQAAILTDKGRLREAQEILEMTLSTFRALGDRYETAIVLIDLGYILSALGDFDGAITRYTEALALFDELSDKKGVAIASTNIAEILYSRGDLDQARTMHEEALAINHEIGHLSGIAYDTYRLGKILAAQGHLIAARRKSDKALELQQDLGEENAAAQTQVELAILELAQGDPDAAVSLARAAEDVLSAADRVDPAAVAGTVLVRALLATGEVPEARQALGRAENLAKESQNPQVGLVIAIAEARLQATSMEGPVAAVMALDQIAADAGADFVEEQFEARLAAGKIEMAAGETAAAAARLTALENEARGHGFLQIANRAAAARGP